MDLRRASLHAEELLASYPPVRLRIERRLELFRRVWARGSEHRLLLELVFCLLTPASRARSAWAAVGRLERAGLLLQDGPPPTETVARELNLVRFRNNKARNVVLALARFGRGGACNLRIELQSRPDDRDRREWLVSGVRGMGYKEASHFLRNIGFFEELVILDRHVLRSLVLLGIAEELPSCLTRKRYLELEEQLKAFARNLGVPAAHLDLLMWYLQTGDLFK